MTLCMMTCCSLSDDHNEHLQDELFAEIPSTIDFNYNDLYGFDRMLYTEDSRLQQHQVNLPFHAELSLSR